MIKSVDYYQQRGVWQSWDLRDVNAPVFCVCVYDFVCVSAYANYPHFV